mgnify:CR=1 FL=1
MLEYIVTFKHKTNKSKTIEVRVQRESTPSVNNLLVFDAIHKLSVEGKEIPKTKDYSWSFSQV